MIYSHDLATKPMKANLNIYKHKDWLIEESNKVSHIIKYYLDDDEEGEDYTVSGKKKRNRQPNVYGVDNSKFYSEVSTAVHSPRLL